MAVRRLALVLVVLAGCRTPQPESRVKEVQPPAPTAPAGPFGCVFTKEEGKSKRYDCEVKGKKIYMLTQEGSFVENSRDNAALFHEEIESSPLEQITREVALFVKDRTDSEKALVKTMLGCLSQRLHESVSQEFADGVDAAFSGYASARLAAGKQPKFDFEDVKLATYGIELGVLMDGVRERVQFGGPIKAAAAIADLVNQCGGTMKNAVVQNFFSLITEEALRAIPFSRGCSGFVADGTLTKDGELVHSRTMDGDIVESWNKAPTIFLIKEPGAGNHPFVATASVGLFYPGGVSGFNDQGISVSIHQMSTINYKLYVSGRKTDLAPYVLQRILRNAGSIDEAIAIAKSMPHIAAWTILVSDGQRNEAASIEFSADKLRVARRVTAASIGQSNHFLHQEMMDQAYTPKWNKTLESRSRFTTLTKQLTDAKAAGKVVDVDWSMMAIGGHLDDMGKFRSFGRTVAKNYTAMATVAVPYRHDGQLPQIWFTIGDASPVPHSNFAGFSVDFANFKVVPAGVKKNDYGKPDWERSVATAIEAKNAAHHAKWGEATAKLDTAIVEAKEDGIDELPYYFMRARMKQMDGDHDGAMDDWRLLWDQRAEVDAYQQALYALHMITSSDLASDAKKLAADDRAARAKFAANTFKGIYADERHVDLKKKWDAAKELVAGKKIEPFKGPDFAVLE